MFPTEAEEGEQLCGVLFIFFFFLLAWAILWSTLWSKAKSKIQGLESKIRDLESEITMLRSSAEQYILEKWLQQRKNVSYRDDAPEVEVEAKFVFPLVKHLGYDEEDIELRTSIPTRKGKEQVIWKADWVLRDGFSGDALVVIEVKAPSVPLTKDVQEQARLYAFHLGAPVYITTNGKEIQIFHRGILKDQCIIACSVEQLVDNWEEIKKAVSKSNVKELKKSLVDKEAQI
jgi:predicted type IV restriction endonuclease